VIGIRVFRQQDVIGITVFRFPLARDTCTAPILLPAGCESVTPTEFLFVARLFFARVLLCQNDKLARVYRRFGLDEAVGDQSPKARRRKLSKAEFREQAEAAFSGRRRDTSHRQIAQTPR
jgi:hypothetical protein